MERDDESRRHRTHWAIEVFDAHTDRDRALQFDAEVADHTVSPDDPAAIAFAIENVGAQTQKVFSGTVPPFSLLWPTVPGANDTSCGGTTRTRVVSTSMTDMPSCATSAR